MPQSSQKKFKCDTCQRHFNRREHLQRHESIHYNLKPFHCDLCRYSCRRRDLLNRHVKLAHTNKESPDNDGNPAPSTDDTQGPSDRRSSLDDELRPLSGLQSAGVGHESTPDHDASIVGDALATPTVFNQPGLSSISPYLNAAGPVFMGPESNDQPLGLNYLDSVCLPPFFEQPPFYPELSIIDPPSISPTTAARQPIGSDQIDLNVELPVGDTRPKSQPGSFPDPGRSHVHLAPFIRVSQEDWEWLNAQISRFSSTQLLVPEIPSRHAISRYMHGFMNGFHPHFPILHPQTLRFREMAPELVLALAAVGSHYCLESHQGLKLFHLARVIALEQIQQRENDKETFAHPPSDSLHYSTNTPHSSSGSNTNDRHGMPTDDQGLDSSPNHALTESMQTLFFLMAMGTWGGEHRSLVRHAIATQSVLAMLVRQHGLSESPVVPMTWQEWARAESARRTKLIVFCFFDLHTITFNLPSPLMVADIKLRLPCSEMEWKAPDSDSWLAVNERSNRPPFFNDCIAALIQDIDSIPACSSLGGHVLIHALLQRIISIQHSMQLQGMKNQMIPGMSASLRRALRKWQSAWEQNPESSYSPLDKHGPVAFNSTALFHLAYIRLAVDIGPARSLLEQNHIQIAKRLHEQPMLQRGSLLLIAARHATAALCSPVQMGVHFVGRAPSWSVMHAVCSLEYAYVLNQFIQATTHTSLEYPLEADEQNLLMTIKETLREVESSSPRGNPNIIDRAPQLLGAKVVRAWAMILEGMRTWNAVDLISRALFVYADLLEPRGFGEKGDDAVIFTFNQGTGSARVGQYTDALFSLAALPAQWENLFKKNPEMPYQSFWALYGQNIRQEGVEVIGDQIAFANYAHIWRTMLDILHDIYCGPNDVSYQPEQEGDYLTGRYIFVQSKGWGRCKIFYETSGTGPQEIVFLHTAGSDSRQYHGVMNNPQMRARCTMYAFDLPSHGRSFPSPEYPAGGHTNSEDAYLSCIAGVIKGLGLNSPILCGASMAGQACIATAIRAEEVGIGGSIPLQGCERVEMHREWHDKSPLINSATFNPEWVYGMMCPTAPHENRQLLWHTYSAQAYGVYHGDLDFYFNGWDGRGRVETINTNKCPIYFLAGEYDWSNTPEMSESTANKLPGAKFKRMPKLGHFPATEDPAEFVPHLLEAIDHICASRVKI